MKPEIRLKKPTLNKTLNQNLKVKISTPYISTLFEQNSPKSASTILLQDQEQNFFSHSSIQYSIKPTHHLTKSSYFDYSPNPSINMYKNISSKKAFPLSKLTNISLQNALFLVTKAIDECSAFHKSFGYSNFQIQNCVISSNGDFILTQTSPTLNYDKFTDETLVVIKIIQSISDICAPQHFNDFITYFKRSQSKNICDFKYVRSLVHCYCRCAKLNIKSHFQLSQLLKKQSNIPYQKLQIPSKRVRSTIGRKSSRKRIKTLQQLQKQNQNNYLSVHRYSNQYIPSKSLTDGKKNVSISKPKKPFLKKMSKSNNQISPQFNLKISLTLSPTKASFQSTLQTSGKQSFIKKQNLDFPILPHHKFDHVLFQNISGSTKQVIPSQRNSKMPFHSVNLKQNQFFQPLCEMSNQFSQKQNQDITSSHPLQKHNQQKIYNTNNWTRRFQNLLTQDKPISHSLIIGKQQQIPKPNLQKLDKYARVLTQSYCAQPNYKKHQSY